MIAGIRLAPYGAIDTRSLQPRGKIGTEKEVVEPQACVARPAVSHVVPERIDALIRMQRANGVGPTLLEQTRKRGTTLRLHQRILLVRPGGIDVALRRHD